jgi:hypothetical protein
MKLKTKKEVLKERPEYKRLINAVISQIGMERVEDVIRHGADTGFSGFTYYHDTHKFAMRYRNLICDLLDETAEQMGENTVEMVLNFGVFRNRHADKDDRNDLYKYLGGARCQSSTITNVMAWFALEEVCRWFEGDGYD